MHIELIRVLFSQEARIMDHHDPVPPAARSRKRTPARRLRCLARLAAAANVRLACAAADLAFELRMRVRAGRRFWPLDTVASVAAVTVERGIAGLQDA